MFSWLSGFEQIGGMLLTFIFLLHCKSAKLLCFAEV